MCYPTCKFVPKIRAIGTYVPVSTGLPKQILSSTLTFRSIYIIKKTITTLCIVKQHKEVILTIVLLMSAE